MSAQDILSSLAATDNNVAAGIAQCLQAFAEVATGYAVTGPILIEFGDRSMALGRRKLTTMTGKASAFPPIHLQTVLTFICVCLHRMRLLC
jgi:hypothetical protein